jgi:hypothetical protein
MTVTGEMWQTHMNKTGIQFTEPTVVFTTEATGMVQEQQSFVSENRQIPGYPFFNFKYITNTHDVSPNSGFMKDIGKFHFESNS